MGEYPRSVGEFSSFFGRTFGADEEFYLNNANAYQANRSYGQNGRENGDKNSTARNPPFGVGVCFAILGLLSCYFWAGCAFVSFYYKRIAWGSALVVVALLTGWGGFSVVLFGGD